METYDLRTLQAARGIDLQIEALILGAHAAVEDDLVCHLCPRFVGSGFWQCKWQSDKIIFDSILAR
jgi:hypothetical protein